MVAKVARHFDVASSLIYTWRRQAAGIATQQPVSFSPAILIEQAKDPALAALALSDPPQVEPVAVAVEFSAGVGMIIGATAPTTWVTATLLALQ